jgi:hypothetical protein
VPKHPVFVTVYIFMQHSLLKRLRFVAAFLAWPAILFAQSDKPVLVTPAKSDSATTITSESRLVNLPVVVRDNKGRSGTGPDQGGLHAAGRR